MKKRTCIITAVILSMFMYYGYFELETYGEELEPFEKETYTDLNNEVFICSSEKITLNVNEYEIFYIDIIDQIDNLNEADFKVDIENSEAITMEICSYEELFVDNDDIKKEIEHIENKDNRIWVKVYGQSMASDVKCVISVHNYSKEISVTVVEEDEEKWEYKNVRNQSFEDSALEFSKKSIEFKVGQGQGFLVYSKDGKPEVRSESSKIAEAYVVRGNYGGDETAYYCEVTAKSPGDTMLVAKSGDKETKIPLKVSASRLEFSKSGIQKVGVGGAIGFLIYTDGKYGEPPEVRSSNPSVVKVVYDEERDAAYKDGYYIEAYGLKEGNATITAEYYGSKKTLEIEVKTTAPEFSKKSIEFKVGQGQGFLVYSKDGKPEIRSESSKIAEAYVVRGNYGGDETAYYCEVTAKSPGDTMLVAKSGDKETKIPLKVSASRLEFSKSGIQKVGVGGAIGFLIYTDGKYGEPPEVRSSNPSVVKVVYDEERDAAYKDGYYIEAYGLKEGDATITAEYYGLKVTLEVEVIKTGWTNVNGVKYYIGSDGKYVKGYNDIDGFRYYFNSEGALSSKVAIDVSQYQPNINWEAVKNDGVEIAIIRVGFTGCGTGSINLDDCFYKHINGALSAGLDVGVYYYSQAITIKEAEAEANFVDSIIEPYKDRIKYNVSFDTESTGAGGRGDKLSRAARTRIADAFCSKIMSHGYIPMIYSNLNWLNNSLYMDLLSEYQVWVAQYNSTNTYMRPYKCWQYTSSGKVDGISGRVDLNVWLY